MTVEKITAQNSELEYGLVNVGVGSIIGGVGAIINKKDSNEKTGKTLLRGMAHGALGGYLVFESKRLLKFIPKNHSYVTVYPSKVINAAGNSIIENAARDDKFWSRWHINFGFSRIEMNAEENFRIRHRIMLFDFAYAIKYFIERRFDLNSSLKLGTLVFQSNLENSNGKVNGNLITLNSTSDFNTVRHELIHTYQYEQLSGINNYMDPISDYFKAKNSFYRNYSKIFSTDFNLYSFWLLGEVSSYNHGYLEKEAYRLK